MNKQWFWGTFIFWCLLGTACAWALIFSPTRAPTQTLKGSKVRLNGYVGENRIAVDPAPLDRSVETALRQWKADGWDCLTGAANLVPIILGARGETAERISALAQVKVFRKKGNLRFLGLACGAGNQATYQWSLEVPEKAIRPWDPAESDFALLPPPAVASASAFQSHNVEMYFWSQRCRGNGPEEFRRLYASQGFNGRVLSNHTDGSVLLLQKGSLRLLAILQNRDGNLAVSLAKLKKPGTALGKNEEEP